MKAMLWRVVYVVLCLFLLSLIVPLFLQFIGVSPSALGMQLLRVCVAGIAILYVLWGPTPPAPF